MTNFRFLGFILFLVLFVGTVSADTLITTGVYGGTLYNAGVNQSWANVHDPINGAVSTTLFKAAVACDKDTNKFAYIYREAMTFNTTVVGGGTVTNVSLLLRTSGAPTDTLGGNIDIVSMTPTNTRSYVAADSGTLGITIYGGRDITGMATNTNYTFYLTSPSYTYINLTGDTVFAVRISNDTANIAPAWALSGIEQVTFSTTKAYQTLTITYTPSATAPVSSFSIQKPLLRIPMTLQVNDTSTNTPTGWNWSWGDGTWTNGTTQNATHKYTTRGLKSILLLTSNAGGSNTTPTASTVRVVGYENYW